MLSVVTGRRVRHVEGMAAEGIRVETVGDMLDHGYTLQAWCNVCRTGRAVDLHRVVMRIGGDVLPRHVRLKCAGCHGRDVSISIASPRGRY